MKERKKKKKQLQCERAAEEQRKITSFCENIRQLYLKRKNERSQKKKQ